MTQVDPPAAPAAARRRAWGWVAVITAIVVLGTVLALVTLPSWRAKVPLDPQGPGPDGAMALVRILEQRGVHVETADSRDEAERAATAGTTLVLGDTRPLSDETLRDVVALADRTVLVDPSSRDAEVLFGDGAFLGTGTTPLDPGCDLPEARRAGELQPGRLFAADAADVACYVDPSGGAGLLAGELDGAEVVLLDAVPVFANASLTEHGNAALALNLLGAHERVVWYLPGPDDVPPGQDPATLGSLTPEWLSPAIVLLLAAVVAAGIWRGRRFGPLVAEDLPVTVRGSETLEGRARLYRRAADPTHAATLIRRGAVARMARRLGLPARATAQEVADAAAVRLGAPRDRVAAILQHQPDTDASLVEFGERLRDLEAAVDAAVRTERHPRRVNVKQRAE